MYNLQKRKKYCLVLGGGGAKGAYQIGVWRALRENHVKIESIIGTSIGTINGALMISSNYKTVLNTWLGLQIDKILKIKYNDKNKIEIKDLFKQFITLGGIDTYPLKQLICKLVDEKKIRKSPIDFGLVSVKINGLKIIEYFKENIADGEMIDYIMASSTLPGFKPLDIDGSKYADGGFYDVIPYNTARKRGYKNIIAVDISGIGYDQKDQIECGNTIFIKNSQDTSNVLDFNTESIERNIKMGYLDAKKTFGYYDSIDYFFKFKKSFGKKLEKLIKKEDVCEKIKKIIEKSDNYNEKLDVFGNIRQILPKEMRLYKNIFIPLIECAADVLQIEPLKYDTLKVLLSEIKNRVQEINSIELPSDIKNFFDKIKFATSAINNYKELVKFFLSNEESLSYLKIANSFNPKLCPALIFINVFELI